MRHKWPCFISISCMIMMQIDGDVGVKHIIKAHHRHLYHRYAIIWKSQADRMDAALVLLLHGKMAHIHFSPSEHKQRSSTTWFLCNYLSVFLLLLNLPVGREFGRDEGCMERVLICVSHCLTQVNGSVRVLITARYQIPQICRLWTVLRMIVSIF